MTVNHILFIRLGVKIGLKIKFSDVKCDDKGPSSGDGALRSMKY